MKITVFGAGAFGTALGEILKQNGHQVSYYDPVKYPDQSLTSIIDDGEVNVLAVPSHAAPKLLLFLPHNKPLICATKGFLSIASFQSFGQNFSLLSGGAFAADLMNKKPSILTTTAPISKELFKADWLEFDETKDVLGVTLCGSFKNVYAIGAGYWELKYGTTDFDDFINAVLDEMRSILSANGCNPATVNLSCGINDLVITCGSPTSRNYDFGAKLKKDPELGKKIINGTVHMNTTEGVTTISQIPATTSFVKPANTPILDRIIALVNHQPVITPDQNA